MNSPSLSLEVGRGGVVLFFSGSANPIILANSAHTWCRGRPHFSLSLCFLLLTALWYPHSSKQQNRNFYGLGCSTVSSKIGISLDCGDALQLCLEFCRHWALKKGAVGCILPTTIICWFIAFKSRRQFSVFGLRLKTVLLQAAQNEGCNSVSLWLAMCPRVSLL